MRKIRKIVGNEKNLPCKEDQGEGDEVAGPRARILFYTYSDLMLVSLVTLCYLSTSEVGQTLGDGGRKADGTYFPRVS